MKIENEITGHVNIHTSSKLQIELCIKDEDEQVDVFALDLVNKEVQTHLENSTRLLIGMNQSYDAYLKLINDLGLEIPESYKKHWTLRESALWYYFIDSNGQVGLNSFSNSKFDNELVPNFNIFPNKEKKKKAVNLSKLGRLILLWQYANDCIFEPDWKNNSQRKYYIKHDHTNNTTSCFGITAQLDTVYFETSEQVEAFIEMYETKIKKIMGVI